MIGPANFLVACRGVLLLILLGSTGLQAASPDIRLMGLDGRMHHLSEYIGRGKWVVLNVWGPGCPPCLEEMPELQLFHDRHSADRAMVVGVAIDYPSYGYADREEVAQFVDDYFIDFPILLGDAGVVPVFGGGDLKGTPTTFVYTPQGELVAVQLGAVTAAIIEKFINNYKK